MFLSHEKDIAKTYFFFSQGSNGAAKINLYFNIRVYSHISPSNIKYENKVNTQ